MHVSTFGVVRSWTSSLWVQAFNAEGFRDVSRLRRSGLK